MMPFLINYFVVVNSDSDEDMMAPILCSTPKPNQAGET